MPTRAEYKMVRDDVPKVDGAVAVGEDLEFQRRWWKFERIIWSFFLLVLIADVSGLLGRGPLAKAERRASDGSLDVKYERVQRANTSSIVTILPQASAIHDGKLELFVSESLLKELGTQRVIPAPQTSTIGGGGVTYTFPVSEVPMTVQLELKPSFVGTHPFTIMVPGGQPVEAKALVLP